MLMALTTYRTTNRERIKKYNKKWRQANPTYHRDYQRRLRAEARKNRTA